MAKQLNIDMSIKADTGQAKRAMLELQKSLNDVIATKTLNVKDDSIKQAKQAAIDLKHHLEAATNVNTGKLDLSKFSASLNKSGQSLQGLYGKLSTIGPAGQSAFLNLAQSIAKADASAISLGTKLGGLATTLKNTMKWQISSSLLHGFIGAIQGAYNYAQDLNESLNNIRIVTGQNVDQMAKFAKEANSAARELSATTTEYTNASLIYYQQGLSDSEVKERTDATIKLANVSKQSAEEVSSQMTAIWNNFAKGDKSLEYYEDVITKLGATTASSSKEIAEGVEKFAAVSDTVDLSYEKATASLATVVAETRQSADTVGTAFKTIFARLEGLKLGQTLEDGTSLNKYSQALKTVGVDIKDQSGELKNMDTILNEIGTKWQTLGKDQQVALAQTVAGVRQYTQFISLMDNYDKVLKNEETARNSEGTVDKQAKIYAESWEAARDRVKAAAEEIYSQLLNDDAFIAILNGFEKFLTFISNVIDGLGGLKGVLLLIGSILTQYYAKEVPVFMQKAIQDIQILTGAAEENRKTMLAESNEIVHRMSDTTTSEALNAKVASMKKVSEMYKELAEKRHTLSSAEIEAYEQKIKDVEMYGELAQAAGKEIDILNKEAEALQLTASRSLGKNRDNSIEAQQSQADKNVETAQNEYNKWEKALDTATAPGSTATNEELEKIQRGLDNATKKLENAKEKAAELREQFSSIPDKITHGGKEITLAGKSGKQLLQIFQESSKQLGLMENVTEKVKEKVSSWKETLNNTTDNEKIGKLKEEMIAYAEKAQEAGVETGDLAERIKSASSLEDLKNLAGEMEKFSDQLEPTRSKIESLKLALQAMGASGADLDALEEKWKAGAISEEEYLALLEQIRDTQQGTLNHQVKFAEGLSKAASTAMQLAMAINSLKNLGNVWSNEDLSTGEKILQTMTALGMAIPVLIGLYKTLFVTKNKDTGATVAGTVATYAKAAADFVATAAQWGLNAAMDANPIGAIVLLITALIAALALLTAAIIAVIGAQNKEEKAVEQANEELENAKELAEGAKQAYEDLKSTITSYDSAIDSLKLLVKGTDEFKAAVQKANEEARKLIKTNDQLKGKYHFNNETGVIEFDEGVLKELEESGESKYNAAQTSELIAANNVSKAENSLALSNASKKNDTDLLKRGLAVNSLTAVNPTLGTGALVTTGLSVMKDQWENAESNAALAHLAEITASYQNITLDKAKDEGLLSDAEYDLIDALGMTDIELKDLTTQLNANTDAITENNKQIVDNSFKEKKEYKYSQNKEELNTALAKKLQPLSDQIYQSTFAAGKGISDQDAQKQYAKAMGYEFIKSDGDSGKYKDAQGEEVSVNNEIARKYLAEQTALESLSGSIKNTDNAITKLKEDSDNIASQAMLSKMTKGDFSDVELIKDGSKTNFTVDELQGTLSDEEFKEIYTSLGYDTAEQFASEFNQQLEQLTSVEDVIESIEIDDSIKQKYEKELNGLFSDLTASEAQNMSKGIGTLTRAFGDEVGENYIDVLDDMTKNLSKEEKKIITKELGKINDIGDAGQWDNFLKSIKDSDKITESVKQSFEGYVKTAKDVANATSKLTFDKFIEDMKKVQDTMKSISEGNRTMDKPTYDTLIKQGVDASKFIRTLSGEYEYIGSATALMQEIGNKKRSELESAIEGFSQASDAISDSAKNVDKLKDNLNQMNESAKENEEEMSGIEKFITLIKNIFSKFVENVKQKIEQVRDGFVIIGTFIKEKVLDPIGKQITNVFDMFVAGINGFLEGFINFINTIITWKNRLTGSKDETIDFEKVKVKDSKAIEAEEKEKKAEEAEKTNHENFIKAAEELIPIIQAEGTQMSKEEREKNEKITRDQTKKAQEMKAEAEEKLKQSDLSDEDKQYYEERKKRADEELEKIKEVNEAWHQVDISILLSADSLEKFDAALAKAESTGEVDYNIIADGLENLAKNYDNCTEEITKFRGAIASGSGELVKAEEANLRNAIAIGEMSKALDLEADKVEEQAKELNAVNKLTEEDYTVSRKVAVLNQSMNKGLKELVDNWDEYKKALKENKKGTEDYANAALKTKEALAQMLGVLDKDYIPDDFLEMPGVMDLIDKAIKGDIKAINALGTSMAKATIDAMEFKEGMKGFDVTDFTNTFDMTLEQFDKYKNEVLEGITNLTQAIQNGTIKAGENITQLMDGNGATWVDALNQMAYATQMTVDEMKSMLNELGVEAEVQTITKEVPTKVPQYTTYTTTEEDETDAENKKELGKNWRVKEKTVTVQTGTKEVTGTVDVAQINMGKENKGKVPQVKYAGRASASKSALTKSDSSSSKSSGSNSSSKNTTKAASQTHEIHRYTAEQNTIDGLTKQYDRLNKAKDKAFGASRIQAMERELKKLKQLKQASSNYLDAMVGSGRGGSVAKAIGEGQNVGSMIASGKIGGEVGADYQALFKGFNASGKGVEYTATDSNGNERLVNTSFNLGELNSTFGSNFSISLDSFGNIKNKDGILQSIENLMNSEEQNFSKIQGEASHEQKTRHARNMAMLTAFKENIETFSSNVKDLGDKIDDYLDRIAKIQEQNAAIISEKMNNEIELGKKTTQKIDRAIKVLGDNIYKTPEAIMQYNQLMRQKAFDKQGDAEIDKQVKEAQERVALYFKPGGQYDENAITPEAANEIYQRAEDYWDQKLEGKMAYVETMKNYYGQVLDLWTEKIKKVTTAIDQNIETFSHLQNVLNLLGRSTDYNAMDKILKGQLESSKYKYNTSKAALKESETEVKRAQQYYDSIKNNPLISDAAKEIAKTTLDQASEKYMSWLKENQQDLENVLTNIDALSKNKISQIYDEAENKLTGQWGSFDALDKAMERVKATADQYLTKTNQLYETNKMLRNLSKDMDKTNSQAAKQRLKDFSDEINLLKNKEKLNKSELEIAQAKYEILKAELALEEIKDAKSTVRLQRDSEGNYGYVYTADQEKIEDAQQQLEDKQNAFYNLLKTQAEESTQTIIRINQEMWQALQELDEEKRNNILMTDEEYQLKKQNIYDTYGAQIVAAQETHDNAMVYLDQVAVQGQEEAWTNGFEDILENQKSFSGNAINETDSLAIGLQNIMNNASNQIDKEMEWLNSERERVSSDAKVGNNELGQTINQVTGTVKGLSNEVTKRGGLVDSMGSAMTTTQNLINKFINEYDWIQKDIQALRTKADKLSDMQIELRKTTDRQKEYNNELERTNRLLAGGSGGGYSGGGSGGGGGGSDGGSGGGGDNGISGGDRGSGTWYCTGRYEILQNNYQQHKVEKKNSVTGYTRWFTEPHVWKSYPEAYGTGKKCACGMMKMYMITSDQSQIRDTAELIRIMNVGTGKKLIINRSWLPNYGLAGAKPGAFKSGGYTGTWLSGKTGLYTGSWDGPDLEENGKLAFLHQKELVLNANDTENMLEAVKLIRQISSQIDLQAASQSSGFQLSATQLSNDREPLQQEITIHAEFPNAKDHNEIEEAFVNLANKASQYANRY